MAIFRGRQAPNDRDTHIVIADREMTVGQAEQVQHELTHQTTYTADVTILNPACTVLGRQFRIEHGNGVLRNSADVYAYGDYLAAMARGRR